MQMKTDDWARRIGEQHGHRDRATAHETQAVIDVERQRHAACLERWPALVAAMHGLVMSYNEGAGLEAVTLAEHRAGRDHPGITFESTTNGRRALVIDLDGSDVMVRAHSGPDDSQSSTRWVSLNRTDENAAAYLLRDWLERL
jgi:hypothetical protein